MKRALLSCFFILSIFIVRAQIKIKASNVIHINDKLIAPCDDEVYGTFPGGMSKFNQYLAKNIHYPAPAVKSRIQGEVLLSFVIEKNGSISMVKIIKSVSPVIDAEALRVLANSPKWTPTKMCGKAVRTKYNIPINFSLNK